MNRYGQIARAYWETYLPSRVKAIPPGQREAFFRDLGRQVETEVQTQETGLAGTPPPDEDYLSTVGRLNNARSRAEEMALGELVYLDPEPGTEDLEAPAPATPSE